MEDDRQTAAAKAALERHKDAIEERLGPDFRTHPEYHAVVEKVRSGAVARFAVETIPREDQ
ncbi:hypothetical protein H7X87_00775 [Acetobacteraceae bacterium]|nr:hypothetical protein [Candidatus Parcubacteria bacterium]